MGKQNKHSVLAVDDHPLFVNGLASVLNNMKNVHKVFTAYNGKEAIELYVKHQPDIVLMDLRMKEMDGFECMEKIREQHADAKFIVVSMHDDFGTIQKCIASEVWGYMIKNADKREIERGITDVMNGTPYWSPQIAKILALAIKDGGMQSPYGKEAEKLSERETQVLQHLISGYTYRQTADRLFLSLSTIKTHAEHIHDKLGTISPYWLTIYALEHHIKPLAEPERRTRGKK